MKVVSMLLLALAAILFFAKDRVLNKNSDNKLLKMVYDNAKYIAVICCLLAAYMFSQESVEPTVSEVSSVSGTTVSSELPDEMFKNE